MRLIVADEISPDSCRLWDMKTGQKLDKDVFRRDLGDLADRPQAMFLKISRTPRFPRLAPLNRLPNHNSR